MSALDVTIYRYYNVDMMRHDHRGPWPDFETFHAAQRGRRRGGGGGRPPGSHPGPGGGWGGGPGDGGGRARFELFRSMMGHPSRRGRGDVRAAILLVLAEQPFNGYQIMQEIERRSEGSWRPSSGSVYPSLQQLEDEGLVSVEQVPAGKQFKLTDRGTKYVAANRAKLGTPWEAQSGDPRRGTMSLLGQLAPALQQVARYGTAEQAAEAERIITDARRALYRLLAEDETEADD